MHAIWFYNPLGEVGTITHFTDGESEAQRR